MPHTGRTLGTHQVTHQRHTRGPYTMKPPQKRKRTRRLPYIFSSDRLDELFWQLLDDGDPQLRAYVYRMQDDRKIIPALFIGEPFDGLAEWLRDGVTGVISTLLSVAGNAWNSPASFASVFP